MSFPRKLSSNSRWQVPHAHRPRDGTREGIVAIGCPHPGQGVFILVPTSQKHSGCAARNGPYPSLPSLDCVRIIANRTSHYSRGPLRMASRSCGEASGTQISPLLPSATIPWWPRKASAALRLGRVVEWPHLARVARIRLRLIAPSEPRSAPRTYSMVSRVGFAPRFEYLREGALDACAMQPSICIHTVYVSLYPTADCEGDRPRRRGARLPGLGPELEGLGPYSSEHG